MTKLFPFIAAFVLSGQLYAEDSRSLYTEQWRPQYHYSHAHNWIGDPCGLLHFDGKFHAYSWGAAESEDLIHWQEINKNAIIGRPKDIAAFTGSVVIDRMNTAGFGDNAYIAAFTSFDEKSKKQSQSIAFSHDAGATYQYYDQNPVLDIWSTEFRDPTVFWDNDSKRWIMLVAKALEKKVAFYASDDLKHWEWLSDFGPAGDSEKSWECPDMFKLRIPHSDIEKWVMAVSVNWDKVQYFIGEFNGKEFIPDKEGNVPLYIDNGIDYYAFRTFRDYDNTLPSVYSLGWASKWDYAQHVPTTYGKGVWTLPRELSLTQTPQGIRLRQKPAQEIHSLREKPIVRHFKPLKAGNTAIKDVAQMDNQYEMKLTFNTDKPNTLGVRLCSDDNHQLSLSYDTKSHYLVLDRTNASEVTLPAFERIAYTKVEPVKGEITLDIFVDKSVVEVFVNDGDCVMTALTFPSASATHAELFSTLTNTNLNLTLYKMRSIWGTPVN